MTLKGRRKRSLDFYINTSFLNSVHICSPVFPVNKKKILKVFFNDIHAFFFFFFLPATLVKICTGGSVKHVIN